MECVFSREKVAFPYPSATLLLTEFNPQCSTRRSTEKTAMPTSTPADKVNLTKALIEGVAPPAKDRRYIYDLKVPGLAFVITANGARSFYLYRRVGGRPERIRLGGYPELTVEQARNKAADLNGQ